jgi:integrase
VLDEARRGTLPGMVLTGATFADAAAEFLRYIEHDRDRKPTTVTGYRSSIRSQLLPVFGEMPVESITTSMIESWIASVDPTASTRAKALVLMHGIFQRARRKWGLPLNPVADVEKPPTRSSGDIAVFSPEEGMALVRTAASEQDAAIYLTAALTGLRRGELTRCAGVTSTSPDGSSAFALATSTGTSQRPSPARSARSRWPATSPRALAKLAHSDRRTEDDDLVFLEDWGGYVDARALGRRNATALERAGRRQLRFHDLRHTFGARMIARADILRVQEWMGHADVQTTMKYLHYAPRRSTPSSSRKRSRLRRGSGTAHPGGQGLFAPPLVFWLVRLSRSPVRKPGITRLAWVAASGRRACAGSGRRGPSAGPACAL